MKQKTKKYDAKYLAIILATVLIVEGALFSVASSQDWQKGLSVLDATSAVSETGLSLAIVFSPLFDTYQDVNQFYELATTEMISLLDLSDNGVGSEVADVYDGVQNFYVQSSRELAELLDFSQEKYSGPPIVAGISITR